MNNKPASSLSLRKLVLSALVAAPLATLPVPLWALPGVTSANVSSSAGTNTTFATSGSTLTITTPDRTVLNWVAFGSAGNTIGSGDTISYVLPSSASAVLNRVTGGAATTIDGKLTSNGQILVLNDAGVAVSSTGNITASGVVLSTLPETEYNFLATGSLALTGTPTTDVSVAGKISVGQAGTVALYGKNVVVGGIIDAGSLWVTNKNGGATALNAGLVVGNTVNNYGNVTINTNGGTADLGATAGTVVITGGQLTVNTGNATTGGSVTQSNAGAVLAIGNGTSAGSLNVDTKTGTTTAGTITLTKGVQGNGGTQLNVTLNSGDASLVDSSGDIQLNTGTASNLSVTANTGSISTSGSVTSATVSLLAAATAGKTISYTAAGNTTFSVITSNPTGSVTLNGNAKLTVPAISSGSITLGGGSLAQTAGLTAPTLTVQTAGNATLTSANDVDTVIFKNSAGNNSFTDSDDVIIGNGTNVTGNLTVNAGTTIALGNASADVITISGNLALNSAGAITDSSDNTTVSGSLTAAPGAGNSITLNGSGTTGLGNNNTYGTINVTSATDATFVEKSNVSLGNVTLSGNLIAYSTSGNIVNSGQLKITGTARVGAGTASAPGTVSLNYHNATAGSGNQIANIRILTDNDVLGLSGIGNYLASSVVIENESGFTGFTIPANIYGTGLQGSVTLTDANNGGIDNTAGVLVLSGTLTLNEGSTGAGTGAINLNNAANSFSAVTVNSKGAVVISAAGPYTVNANLGSSASTASYTSGNALTIGSYTSLNSGATSFTSAAGKSISDSSTGISIFGPVSFSGGSLNVTNSGHNFGGITIDTSGSNGAATIKESGTLNLLSVKTGTGAFSGTSSNGNIIQGTGTTGIITTTSTGTATLSATSGSVTLDDATNNSIAGAIAVSAKGNSTVSNKINAILGNSTISSGGLTVDVSGVAGSTITQASSSKIYSYGATTFKTNNAALTVGNTGNQFGALTLSSGTGAVTLKEMTTVNLKSVSTTGNLAVTSEAGNIIDSGTVTAGTGATTYTASNGSVTLSQAGSDYATVGFTTGGNVSIVDGVGNLALSASTVGGTFTATNSSGNISQTGTLIITGDTTFNASAAASSILLGDNANQFGGIKFLVGTGGAYISELTTMNLRAGTVANGQVTLHTGGSFTTSGTGGSTFLATTAPSLSINATGSINPGTGSLVVLNGLVVNSPASKDLSGLSLSGNLFGVSPTNQGTGAYTAPSP